MAKILLAPSLGRKMLLILSLIALACSTQAEHTVACTAEAESCLDSPEDEAAFLQTESLVRRKHVKNMADTPVLLDQLEEINSTDTATTTAETGAAVVGVALNAPGDIYVFLQTLCLHSCMVIGAVTVFSLILRQRYPMMYRYKELTNQTSVKCDDSIFGWIRTVWRDVNLDQVQAAAGLDGCMLVAFTQLSMKIMLFIGIPLMFIDAPMHAFLGGNAAGTDILSYAGMGNLQTDSHPAIYYFEALFTIYIVCAIMSCVYTSHRDEFLPRRMQWLKSMAKPRSTTVLVEGISDEWRSDRALKTYFCRLFGESKIKNAFIIKYTEGLCSNIVAMKSMQDLLKEAQFAWKQAGETEETRPQFSISKSTDEKPEGEADCINYYTSMINHYKKEVEAERKNIDKWSIFPEVAYDQSTGKIKEFGDHFNPGYGEWEDWSYVYSSNGFVEFNEEREAALAINVQTKPDELEMATSLAPSPDDIIYTDFQRMDSTIHFWTMIGYGLIAGLFFGFMPIVTGISSVTNLNMLAKSSSFARGIIQALGPLKSMIQGVLASLGLTIFMDFLPTFLMIIFYRCFQLKANAWAQHNCQIYYFWFQVIFIVLVSAVGGSIATTIEKIVQKPTMFFTLLAASLPASTHFYMNFLMLQWFTHTLNLTRYMYITKFLIFKGMYELEEAKKKAEPEDQDYYGYGGRSARFGVNLVIGMVFSQLCPFITLLCFICFVLCRTFYGYLYTFAENKKPDMGGIFWVTQVEQVQKCVVIFIITMNGVYMQRAPTWGVFFVSLLAWPVWIFFWWRFHHHLQWEQLPFETFKKGEAVAKRPPPRTTFQQPELVEEMETILQNKWPM